MIFHLVCCLNCVNRSADCILFTYLCQCADGHAVACCRSPLVQYVVVPALPRGASVEWQVTAVTDAVNWQGRLSV